MTTSRVNSLCGSTTSNAVSLKPIEVPESLQKGEKFIKWDEVSRESSGKGRIPDFQRVLVLESAATLSFHICKDLLISKCDSSLNLLLLLVYTNI